jgi:short-subunit dehydrogenase
VARRRERLETLAEQLPSEAHCIPCDLGDVIAREKLLEALADGPAVVALCNSAGLGGFGRVWTRDLTSERGLVDLDVGATHHLTAALVGGMVERGAGAILNISSGAGFQPIPWTATYAAAKAFVNSFTESLHSELHGTGVSATVLCTGPVRTEFMAAAGAHDSKGGMPEFMWATAEEIARAGIEGMLTGTRVVTPKLTDKLNAIAGRHIPHAVLLPTLRALMRRAHPAG